MREDNDMTGGDAVPIRWGPGRAAGLVNGRPTTEMTTRVDRLTATFELMTALLDETGLAEVLTFVATRARAMAGADLAFIALPGTETGMLSIDIAVGAGAQHIRRQTVHSGRSMIGRVFTTRRALATKVAGQPLLPGLPPGPILLLPLETGEATRGVLALAGPPTDLPFSASVQRHLFLFATTAATLVDIAEDRRATAAAMAFETDRGRPAYFHGRR